MTGAFTESIFENAALSWLKSLGYAVFSGPDIAAGMHCTECRDPNYREAVLGSCAVHQCPRQTQFTLGERE